MLRWPWLWSLAALPLPLLVRVLLPRSERARSAALRVPFFEDVRTVGAAGARPRHTMRISAAVLCWGLLVLAACRPQWLGEPTSLPLSGRDLLMAVDISGSMKTRDMKLDGELVTRVDMVKQVAGEFLERRLGDRLGLIVFGTRPYLLAPLTFDRATVRTLLTETEIGLAGERTAIGDAIGLAVKRLRSRPAATRVLVLLTDGANTAGVVEPLQAAGLAGGEGLRIHTIGVGADELLVRDVLGVRRVNPSVDLDEATLGAIAEATGGRYFRARDTAALREIYALLDELEPVEADVERLRPVAELYVWPLGLALLVVALLAVALVSPWRDARGPTASRASLAELR